MCPLTKKTPVRNFLDGENQKFSDMITLFDLNTCRAVITILTRGSGFRVLDVRCESGYLKVFLTSTFMMLFPLL